MNTHKEEPKFKVGDRVIYRFYPGTVEEVLDFDIGQPWYKVKEDETGQVVQYAERKLKPLKEGEVTEKNIGNLEPTPPSQIEENTRFVENFESDDNDYDMLTIKQLKILENYHTRQLKVIEGKLEDSVNNTK